MQVLYICPWSFRDPLCQSQSLAYIKGLVANGHKFALITFESGRFEMSTDEIARERSTLMSQGIEWHPVKWGTGNSLADKIGGIVRVIVKGLQIGIRTRQNLVHSRSSLPAFMAVVLKKLLRAKFLYDADSLLSEEYLETGHFSRESKAYKFLAWSEGWARRNADHIIVLTEKLKQDYVERFNVTAPIAVIPCCVDLRRFERAGDHREKRRAELGVTDEPLFIYVGKAGSWYLVEETFELFRVALDRRPECHLLIVTPDKPDVFLKMAEDADVPVASFSIRSAGFDEVGEWMAAADVALSLIKPLKSKRGSSPVKFAEYLACGLPVISTEGIGDIDELIVRNKVGSLISRFDVPEYERALTEIGKLSDLGEQGPAVAIANFDLVSIGGNQYTEVYRSLLS